MLSYKRLISISLFILALSFSIVTAQNTPTSNTTIITTANNSTTVNSTITNINTTTVNTTITANSTTTANNSTSANNSTTANSTNTAVNNTNYCSSANVSRSLECWLQPNCLPCVVSNGFVCLPMMSNGTEGQFLTGKTVCEITFQGYLPNIRNSIWDGERPWVYKLINRQDMRINRTATALLSQSYFVNVTQRFVSVRELYYNATSLENIQSLVNQSSNGSSNGQATINQTKASVLNDWSLDVQQNQNFTNTSKTDLAQMWNYRYQAINQSLINASYTALLVREYYNISSVYYCFAAQRLQQHISVLREFFSLVEIVQQTALYSSYQQIGILYEQRYLCSSNLSSNNTSNSTANSTTSNSGNVTSTSSGSSTSNSTSGNGITTVTNVTSTTNATTVSNTTSVTTVTTTQNNSTLCSSWNATWSYQMISAEQYKQTLIWYYLYQIEEVRAYIEEIYFNASDLVTKKCEEENYFGGYLDSEFNKLENNRCVSNLTYLFNVTSNATFVNDTMDVLLDFMGEIDYVNATVVNQNDTTALNLTWLFTVQREIDWDNQDLYNVSSEFCNSIVPYLIAVYGAGVNTTWCYPSLAVIVNETQSNLCHNETSSNQSSNVPSPSASSSSNSTSSNVPSPSASSTNSSTTTTTSNVPSPSESSTNSTTTTTTSSNEPSPSTTTNSTTTTTTSSNEPTPPTSTSSTTTNTTSTSSSSSSSSNENSSNSSASSSSSSSSTTTSKRQADTDLSQNSNTTNSTTVYVNSTIQNTTIVNTTVTVVNSTVNTTIPCNGTVPSPSTNQTGNNTNSTETRHRYSKITFTIPVFMFPCNASNVTISNTTVTTNSTVSNRTSTSNETVSSNSTVPAPKGNSSSNSTVPAPNGNSASNGVSQPAPAIGSRNEAQAQPNASSFLAVSVFSLLLLACMV